MINRNHLSCIIIAILSLALVAPIPSAEAWHGGWRGGWHGGHGRWNYGWGWPVGVAVLGATATALWIAGHQYYYYDGLYYDYTPYGYVVVTPPVVTANQGYVVVTPSQQELFSINVPNDKGGYTTVVVKRSASGYTGPQGEFYAQFPTVAQLKLIYGK